MFNDKKRITNLMTPIFLVMDDMSVFFNDERWENGVDLIQGLEKAWEFSKSHTAVTDEKKKREGVLDEAEEPDDNQVSRLY